MINEFTLNIEKYQALTIPATNNLFKSEIINTLNNNKVELLLPWLGVCYYAKE